MTRNPTARDLHAAVTEHRLAVEKLAEIRLALGVGDVGQVVFSPQPYPLFLADCSGSSPLVGRIVGWSTGPGLVPQPVVVFEDGGSTCVPVAVDLLLGMGGGGPMWIRDTAGEALSAATAYVRAGRGVRRVRVAR